MDITSVRVFTQRECVSITLALILIAGCVPKTTPKSNSKSADDAPKVMAPAFDTKDVVFGPELEFTDPATSEVDFFVVSEYLQTVKKLCAIDNSVVCIFEDKNVEIKSKSGPGRIKVFPYKDPAVLEIPLDPMTIQQAEDSKDILAKYVWGATKAIGLVPGTEEVNRWSAHTNFSWPGLRTGEHSDLMLRYLVDFNNNPELAMGAFSGDIRNAPPLAIFSDRVQLKLQSIVEDFNNYPDEFDVFSLAKRIRIEVYTEEFRYDSGNEIKRFAAINLQHLKENALAKQSYGVDSPVRIEQRASYMPPSEEHFISNIRVIAGRLNYLSKQRGPIHYAPPRFSVSSVSRVFEKTGVQEGLTKARVAKSYVAYLEQAKLDVKYHVKYMINPEVRVIAESLVNDEASKVTK